MALTLAEKYAHNPFIANQSPCDLEAPPATTSAQSSPDEPSDVHIASLLAASIAVMAVATLLWISSRAVKWSFRQLLLKLSGRHGRGVRLRHEEPEDDDSTTMFGSPLTPPPNGWLRDADDVHPTFITPQPAEPLLFSLSPALGGGGAAAAAAAANVRQLPHGTHLPTMQSVAGLAAGSYLGRGPGAGRGSAGGTGVGPLYGSPEAEPWRHRSPGGAAGGGAGCGSGSGGRSGGGLSGGWDLGLLARQAALLPAISSVDGLMASAEFQEHVRSTRGRSPFLERDQSQAKVQLYKDLRRLDPDAFRRLMSRDDVRTYEVRPPPLVFALADYVAGVLLVPLALVAIFQSPAAAAGSALLRYVPLCMWLAVRLRLAISGHVSLLGRVVGAYLVYDIPVDAEPGNAWEGLAGVGGHLLLALFELLMAGLSCGLLAVGALVSIAASPRRQTLAMRLLGLRLEQEVCRPTRLSPFSPASDPMAVTTSKSSSQRSYKSLPGRYGLSHR